MAPPDASPLSILREIRAAIKTPRQPTAQFGSPLPSANSPGGTAQIRSSERVQKYLKSRALRTPPGAKSTAASQAHKTATTTTDRAAKRMRNSKKKTPTRLNFAQSGATPPRTPLPAPPSPSTSPSSSPKQPWTAEEERLAMRKIRDLARAHNRYQRYTEDRKRLPHSAKDLEKDLILLFVLLEYAGGAPITSSPRKLVKDVSDFKVRYAIAELIRLSLANSESGTATPERQSGSRTPLPSPPSRPGLCAPVETLAHRNYGVQAASSRRSLAHQCNRSHAVVQRTTEASS